MDPISRIHARKRRLSRLESHVGKSNVPQLLLRTSPSRQGEPGGPSRRRSRVDTAPSAGLAPNPWPGGCTVPPNPHFSHGMPRGRPPRGRAPQRRTQRQGRGGRRGVSKWIRGRGAARRSTRGCGMTRGGLEGLHRPHVGTRGYQRVAPCRWEGRCCGLRMSVVAGGPAALGSAPCSVSPTLCRPPNRPTGATGQATGHSFIQTGLLARRLWAIAPIAAAAAFRGASIRRAARRLTYY